MSITIGGLSKKQVRLLDAMWAIDSYDEFQQWYETHSESDRRMIDCLQQMVVAESFEEDLTDFSEATAIINKIKNKN